MKSLVTLLITVFASAAFAGGSGGGVMMNNFMVRPDRAFELGGAGGGGGVRPGAEIFFHMGQENGIVKFAYGQLNGNQWEVHKLQIPSEELVLDSSASLAIQKSKNLNKWIPIQN